MASHFTSKKDLYRALMVAGLYMSRHFSDHLMMRRCHEAVIEIRSKWDGWLQLIPESDPVKHGKEAGVRIAELVLDFEEQKRLWQQRGALLIIGPRL